MFSLGGRSLLFSFYPPERRKALADFLRWILFSGRRLITFRLFFVREKPFLTIETLYVTVYCGMCVLATQTHRNRIVFFFAGNRNSFCFVLYVVLTDMPSVSLQFLSEGPLTSPARQVRLYSCRVQTVTLMSFSTWPRFPFVSVCFFRKNYFVCKKERYETNDVEQ